MKNTNNPVQDVLDRANRTRHEEYEKLCTVISRFRAVAVLASTWADQLEQDPSFRYGRFPCEDAGQVVPEAEPDYQRPSGCDGCPFRDFAVPD